MKAFIFTILFLQSGLFADSPALKIVKGSIPLIVAIFSLIKDKNR